VKALRLASVLLTSGLLAGCKPVLYALSPPPPGRSAWLDSKDSTLEVSQGIAIAIACEKDGPCRHATARADDPSIAEVVPAHLARLDARTEPGFTPTTSMVPATSFVLIARSAGHTVVRVRSADGDRDLDVTVVPAPTRAPVQTVAR